jgi:hypothetical protein
MDGRQGGGIRMVLRSKYTNSESLQEES